MKGIVSVANPKLRQVRLPYLHGEYGVPQGGQAHLAVDAEVVAEGQVDAPGGQQTAPEDDSHLAHTSEDRTDNNLCAWVGGRAQRRAKGEQELFSVGYKSNGMRTTSKTARSPKRFPQVNGTHQRLVVRGLAPVKWRGRQPYARAI